jgi:ADP-ribosylglycohydrolase
LPDSYDLVAGSLYGLAYGDALGKPTEFLSFDEITARYGAGGPRDLPPDPHGVARVTDDTQMALAVADALIATLADDGALTNARFEPHVRECFVDWWRSPENNRAPGRTCLTACESLASGLPWRDATVMASKGCGANMRVTPVAVAYQKRGPIDDETRAGAAQLQAAVTHGHATALAASELTMLAVRWLLDGTPLADLTPRLRSRCAEQRITYRADWLGDLWRRSHAPSRDDWTARGWDECAAALDRLTVALERPDRHSDPCDATGQGWIAEEALATALHCALLYPDDPVAALGRAAATSGDSDSIAALTGAMVGAVHGLEAFPHDWRERIEYRVELDRIVGTWTAAQA